jgi:hypothetical protein
MMLNIATSRVAIDDVSLKNAENLGEQSVRSVDMLARNPLFDMYMGGNTRVSTTLGGAAMSTNAVPVSAATGNYLYYADPIQLTGLYIYLRAVGGSARFSTQIAQITWSSFPAGCGVAAGGKQVKNLAQMNADKQGCTRMVRSLWAAARPCGRRSFLRAVRAGTTVRHARSTKCSRAAAKRTARKIPMPCKRAL